MNIESMIKEMKKGKILIRENGIDIISRTYPIICIDYKNGKSEYIDNKDIYLEDIKIEELNKIKNIRIVGSSSGENYKVEYYFFNSQCNRCFAKLTNGCSIDYTPSLIDFIYNKYKTVTKEEYRLLKIEREEEPLEVTMEDIYIKYGRKVIIKPLKED